MNFHYLPEATFLLSFGMSMLTLYKISKVAKLEKDDAEIIKVLRHYKNANIFAVLSYLLVAGIFYALYYLTDFNNTAKVATVVISGIISVLLSNMIDNTKEVTNMYHEYKESQE